MKKSVSILLALCLLLTTAACGQSPGASTIAPSSTAALLFEQKGDLDRAALKTEHFTFTQGETVYLFAIVFNQYSSTMSQYGVDLSKSLKEQLFTLDSSGDSWFDVLMEEVYDYAENYLLFCEGSEARGLKLDQSDEEYIASQKSQLEKEAAEYGWDVDLYLSHVYGTDISWKYVEALLRKIRLGQKVYNAEVGDLVFSEEELEQEYSSNIKLYGLVDYYSFNLGDGENLPAEAVNEAREAMKQVTNFDEYKKAVSEFLQKTRTTEEIETAGGLDALTEKLLLSSRRIGYPYSDSELMNWAFAEDTQEGTVCLIENSQTQAPYANFLEKGPYRDESETKDVRHILFMLSTYGGHYATADAAHKEAERVLEEWKSSGATEDRFIELCAAYSEDGNALSGGLYTNVYKGQMVQEFEDWCFDPARKAGDTGIVDTVYGAHIIYFVASHINWIADVEDALRSSAYNKLMEDLKTSWQIEKNEEVINGINW